MSHAADQMATMNLSSVTPPSASVWIKMEKKFQEVENLHTVLQTVLNLVCYLLHDAAIYLNDKRRFRRKYLISSPWTVILEASLYVDPFYFCKCEDIEQTEQSRRS